MTKCQLSALLATGLFFTTFLPLAHADHFVITAKNRDGSDITDPVTLRVVKLVNSTTAAPVGSTINSTFIQGGQLRTSVVISRPRGALTFTFDLDSRDDALTIGGTNDDKDVLFVFSRGGVDTALVPFFALIGANHTFTVTVPAVYGGQPPSVAPPPEPCEPYWYECVRPRQCHRRFFHR